MRHTFVYFSAEELALLAGCISLSGLESDKFTDLQKRLLDVHTELQNDSDQLVQDAYRGGAKELYQFDDEISTDPDALVRVADGGAFVMTWTWVSDEVAGFHAVDDEEEDAA